MAYTLEVYHAGQTFSYGADLIAREDNTVQEAATAESVEMGDVEVSIGSTFLGASSIFSLPPHDGTGQPSWRARLLFGGEEVLSGIIKRDRGALHDELRGLWVLTVADESPEDFLRSIEEVRLRDPSTMAHFPSGTEIDVLSRDLSQNGYHRIWHRLDKLWEAVVSAAEPTAGATLTFTEPAPLFSFSVRYLDSSSVERTITRAPVVAIDCMYGADSGFPAPIVVEATLPDWNGRQIFEALQRMHGWRVRTRYDVFPSRSIIAEALPDRWEEPANPPDLFERMARAGEERLPVLVEGPEYEDLALQYANPLNEDLIYRSGQEVGPNYDRGLGQAFIPQAQRAIAGAAVRLKVDPKGERLENDDLFELPFRLPHLRLTIKENVVPDPGSHPDFAEDLILADDFAAKGIYKMEAGNAEPAQAACYIGTFFFDSAFSRYRMVAGRIVKAPAAEQEEVVGELWPETLLENYDFSRREHFVLEKSFHLGASAEKGYVALAPDALRVGEFAKGVELLGRTWFVESRDHSARMSHADLVLRTVAGELSPVAGKGGDGYPLAPPSPVAACACNAEAGTFSLSLAWPADSSADDYEIEYWPFYGSSWQALTVTAGTSHDFDEAIQGNGPYRFRLRSRTASGGVSAWSETIAYCSDCSEGEDGGGEEPGSGSCIEVRQGTATITSANTSVTIKPDPLLPVALNSFIHNIRIFATPTTTLGSATSYRTGNRTQYTFDIILNQAPGQSVGFDWLVSYYRTDGGCAPPCWRRDTWHSASSPCAPFATLITAPEVEPLNWTVALALSDRIIYTEAGGLGRSQRVWQYHPPTIGGGNMHERLPDLDVGYHFDIFKIGDTVYAGAFSGDIATGMLMRRLDGMPSSPVWTALPNSPITWGSGSIFIEQGGLVYILGTGQATYPQTAYTFNGSAFTTAPSYDLPIGLLWACGCALGGELYVFGGWTTDQAENLNVYKHNGSAWVVDGVLPSALIKSSAVAMPNHGRIHLLGHNSTGSPSVSAFRNWRYAPGGTLTTVLAQTPNRHQYRGGVYYGGVIYMVCNNEVTEAHRRVWGYCPPEGALNPFTGEPAF